MIDFLHVGVIIFCCLYCMYPYSLFYQTPINDVIFYPPNFIVPKMSHRSATLFPLPFFYLYLIIKGFHFLLCFFFIAKMSSWTSFSCHFITHICLHSNCIWDLKESVPCHSGYEWHWQFYLHPLLSGLSHKYIHIKCEKNSGHCKKK